MASKTKKLELVRKRKASRAGSKRKAELKNHGTTVTPKQLFGDE